MRRFVVLCAFATAMSATTALAGLIHGIVRFGGKPVGEGTTVSIRQGDQGPTRVGTTDKNGTYRVNVPEEGWCTLSVTYKKKTPNSIKVYSFKTGVRYNLVLEIVDGGLTLRKQ
jgi:hypothetical protein